MAVLLNSGIILSTRGVDVSVVLALTGLVLLYTAIGDEIAHYRIVRVAASDARSAELAPKEYPPNEFAE
jgi:simple sugar transport system permease protein